MLTLYQTHYTIYGTFTFGKKNSFAKVNATETKDEYLNGIIFVEEALKII